MSDESQAIVGRRRFLRTLLGLAGVGAPLIGATATWETRLQQPSLNGFQRHEGTYPSSRLRVEDLFVCPLFLPASKASWARLYVDERLTPTREPDAYGFPQWEVHDGFMLCVSEPDTYWAGRIDWCGRTFGYLPRQENTVVAQVLDRGEQLTARITALPEMQAPRNNWIELEDKEYGVHVWLRRVLFGVDLEVTL